MNREVVLMFAEEFSDVTANTSTHVSNGIGYLVMWAIHSERYSGKLSLYGDREGNLNATYRNKEGDVTYTIFGLRGEDGSYSFHS